MKSSTLFFVFGILRLIYADVIMIPSENPIPKTSMPVKDPVKNLDDFFLVNTPDIYNTSQHTWNRSYRYELNITEYRSSKYHSLTFADITPELSKVGYPISCFGV